MNTEEKKALPGAFTLGNVRRIYFGQAIDEQLYLRV